MDSFALSGDGKVVLQEGQRFSAPGTSIDGAGAQGGPQIGGVRSSNNFGAIGQTAMKSIMALDKLTDGAMKSYVEQVEKIQYHEGMTKIVQGQTLQQVKDEDPWYMNIMGPSATVRGAQAMTATNAIQQAETKMFSEMQDDRELTPDAYREKLRTQYLAMGNTGDPLVDMMAQSKFAEANASLARTHLKEHLAFQQERSFNLFMNNNVSIGDSMAAKRAAAKVTDVDPDEQMKMANEAVEAFKPLPGMSYDSWQKASVATLATALKKGNFDYYNAIKGNAEVWSRVDVKSREALEDAYDTAVASNAQKSPLVTDITNSIGNFKFNLSRGQSGITTEDELHGFIDKYNERYRVQTGAAEPYINNTVRQQMLVSWHAGRAHLADKLAAATNKAAEKDELYKRSGGVALDAFVTGNYSSLRGLDLDRKGVVDAMDKNYEQEYGSGDPDRMKRFMERAAASSFDEKLRPPRMEQALRVGISGLLTGGGLVTPSQKQAYVMAQQLYATTNGPEALSNFVGAAEAAKVAGLINSGVSMDDPKAMTDQLVRMQKGGTATASEAERKEVIATVKRADPGFFKSLLPWGDRSLKDYCLTDESKQALGERIAGRAAQYARAYGVSVEQASRMVMAEEVRNSDVIGGTVIQRLKNNSVDTSLASAVNALSPGRGQQHTDLYQSAATNVIGNRLGELVKERGGDMANYKASDFQVANGVQMGDGSLQVVMLPKDATLATKVGVLQVILKPQAMVDEIMRLERERTTRRDEDEKNKARSRVVQTGFGPTVVPR